MSNECISELSCVCIPQINCLTIADTRENLPIRSKRNFINRKSMSREGGLVLEGDIIPKLDHLVIR